MIKKTCVILFVTSLILGCQTNKIESKDLDKSIEKRSIESIGFNKTLVSLIDSFIVKIHRHRDRNNIDILAYIRICEMKNDTFNITMEAINDACIYEKINIDDYFFRDNVCFYVDYNITKLLKTNRHFKLEDVEKQSKIRQYRRADTNVPCWRVLVYKNDILRINKYADSPLGYKTGLAYTDENGKPIDLSITDWGEIIDENGNFIGYYTGVAPTLEEVQNAISKKNK